METDRAAIEAALSVQNLARPEQARVVRIKNTLDLGPIQLSASLLREFGDHPDLAQTGPLAEMAFDGAGRLR